MNSTIWLGILGGSFLAFYAFIGFEDMVNVAEEIKDVEKTLPRAIIITLVVTTLIYVLVTLVAVLSIPPRNWQQNTTQPYLPGKSGSDPALISLIEFSQSLMALIQMIGIAGLIRHESPIHNTRALRFMGDINSHTRTPVKPPPRW